MKNMTAAGIFFKSYYKVLLLVSLIYIPTRLFYDNEFDAFYFWCIVHDFNLFGLIDIAFIMAITILVMRVLHIKLRN